MCGLSDATNHTFNRPCVQTILSPIPRWSFTLKPVYRDFDGRIKNLLHVSHLRVGVNRAALHSALSIGLVG